MGTFSKAECEDQSKKFDFVWAIENFSLCKSEVGHVLKSSEFSADPSDAQQPKWHLELYPGGDKQESKDFVSIYLRLAQCNKTTAVSAKYKCSILNGKRKKIRGKGSNSFDKFSKGHRGGWTKFIRRDLLLDERNELVPEGRLTIFCRVSEVVETLDMSKLSIAEARERFEDQLELKKFDHIWAVENFSSYGTGVGWVSITSPIFSADPNDEQQPKWRLKLYPRGGKEKAKGYVSLYLYLYESKTPTVRASYGFAIPCAKGGNTYDRKTHTNQFEQGGGGYGISKFIRRDTLLENKEELLPEDRLIIFVRIIIEKVIEIPQYCLSEDMGAMLVNNLFTDCVICSSGNEQFKAHKCVLACRSPVFAAMFGYDTAEAREGIVRIGDITGPVLGQLLKFVYTGQAPPLLTEQGMAEELLVAAEKYHLDRLKALCEQQLSMGMNKENVCETLALADLHNAQTLKQHAIARICRLEEDAVREAKQKER